MINSNLFNPTANSAIIIKNDLNLAQNLTAKINELILKKRQLVKIELYKHTTIIKFKKD
jgi:hypothetical protein